MAKKKSKPEESNVSKGSNVTDKDEVVYPEEPYPTGPIKKK